MSKQDRQGVRKASDIEQKYGLGQFMYNQNQKNQDLAKGLSDLGESLSSYKEENNENISKMKENTDDNFKKVNESIGGVAKDIEALAKGIFNMIYPVGHIYFSVSPENPSTLFGGTWERIEDTFLLASGSSYSAGATGGEATHMLTTNEMPSHFHQERFPFDGDSVRPVGSTVNEGLGFTATSKETSANYKYLTGSIAFSSASTSKPVYPVITSSAGSGAAHNNMPPYLAVYVWKRVS